MKLIGTQKHVYVSSQDISRVAIEKEIIQGSLSKTTCYIYLKSGGKLEFFGLCPDEDKNLEYWNNFLYHCLDFAFMKIPEDEKRVVSYSDMIACASLAIESEREEFSQFAPR